MELTFTCYACPDGRCFSKTRTCPLEFGTNSKNWIFSKPPEDWHKPYVTVVD